MPMNTFDYKKVKRSLSTIRDCVNGLRLLTTYGTGPKRRQKRNRVPTAVSLNGLWKFHYAKNYADVVAGFS